jgi:cob(I)alamin adenosyltransferase
LKSYDRVETFGEVDELNSLLGLLISLLPDDDPALVDELHTIQSDILHVGSWLATIPDSPAVRDLKPISIDYVRRIEEGIDRMAEVLPELKHFILPGGHICASCAHVARSVCRRAERHVVRLTDDPKEKKNPERLKTIITYLNRLSDYLFTLARYCNRKQGVPETQWKR